MSQMQIERRHDHQAPVEVYHRTLEHFGLEILHPNDLMTMCRECYKELHQHGDCAGPEHGGGCFHEEMRGNIERILQYERDVCSDVPFENEWNDRQEERFRRLHSRPLQEAWIARMNLLQN